jgi:hypothetical protein
MSSTTNRFLNKLAEVELIKQNPTLWQHFNQEISNLNDKTVVPSKQVQCVLCFTPKQPKLIIKSRKNSKTKKNNKKVFAFCKICGHKVSELCGELKSADKIKNPPVHQNKITETMSKIDTTPNNAESLSSNAKKKKKKKEANAGLIIPPSLLKAG